MKGCFWPLLKIELLSLFGINKALKSKDDKAKKKLVGFTLASVILLVTGVAMSAGYSVAIATLFKTTGGDMKIMPTLMFSVCSLLVLFSTVHSVNGVIFGFKDYESIMALPVKTYEVVLAKTTFVYLVNLGLFALTTIPSSIVYFMVTGASDGLFLVRYFVALPFLPLLPMTLGMILGTVISVISSRFKKSSLFSLVLYAVVMTFYFAAVYTMDNDAAIANIVNSIYNIYPVNKVCVWAVCQGDPLAFSLFILCSVALFVLFVFVVGKLFCKVNSFVLYKSSGNGYSERKHKCRSELSALFIKEVKRFFSSSIVVTNSLGGVVVFLILCVMLLFKDPLEAIGGATGDILPGVDIKQMIDGLIPIVPVLFVGMGCYPACCLSLEGKQLWIVKSLPLDVKKLYLAKIFMGMLVSLPASVVCSLVLGYAFKLSPLSIIFAVLISAAYSLGAAVFGLFINLKFPSFDWENEAAVVKRGAAVSIYMLVGIFTVLPLMAIQGVFLLINAYLGHAVILALIIVADVTLSLYVFGKGVSVFDKL